MNKQEERKKFIKIRSEISIPNRIKKSEVITSKLIKLIDEGSYDVILLYAPLKDEVNISGVFNHFYDKDRFFPRVNGDTMEFYKVDALTNLEKGNFNVSEPKKECEAIQYDRSKKYICVMPGVSYDERGYRIGYGKGYYDKYLASVESANIYKVGVCFEDCKSDGIETEESDIKADTVIFA